ncbi:hypothetical protein ACFFWE_14460 [Sphaerisporangium melleum]|uniref:hypothetical protein n=1 Tax=Sphaerisporangium melleum TaxID=321316 RepID=UPI0016646D61|nr:hypothetical protein [Sphaerisporangium melleum]
MNASDAAASYRDRHRPAPAPGCHSDRTHRTHELPDPDEHRIILWHRDEQPEIHGEFLEQCTLRDLTVHG